MGVNLHSIEARACLYYSELVEFIFVEVLFRSVDNEFHVTQISFLLLTISDALLRNGVTDISKFSVHIVAWGEYKLNSLIIALCAIFDPINIELVAQLVPINTK